jgi:glutamate synthase (NADPH/NADH) small chain
MGKPTGFMEYPREPIGYTDALERITHWREFQVDVPVSHLTKQGARCMDCGVPFCQSATGCPWTT